MSEQYSPGGFRLLPPVVKNLLILNGLVYLGTLSMQYFSGIDLEELLGFYYFKSPHFQAYQLITYMFVHANFMHIFYNMFALWMFGYLLENAWGSKRFLSYYLLTGIGAALIQNLVLWFNFSSLEASAALYSQAPALDSFIAIIRHHFPQYYEYNDTIRNFIGAWTSAPKNPEMARQSTDIIYQLIRLRMDVPTIGASGAVYGILLAFGMMFPNLLVYLFFFFPLRAKYLVILYGAIELFSGISNNPSDNVAHFAHLGGMLVGLVLILIWRRRTAKY
jgi:membrane associated rhomboid family serine protease